MHGCFNSPGYVFGGHICGLKPASQRKPETAGQSPWKPASISCWVQRSRRLQAWVFHVSSRLRLSSWTAGKRRQVFKCGESYWGLSALAFKTWVMPARRCQDRRKLRKLTHSGSTSEAHLQSEAAHICTGLKGSHILPMAGPRDGPSNELQP